MESIHKNAIKIVLTKTDLSRFGLDYEKLSCENMQTRALINNLLETAAQDFGFDRKGKQLSIRTLPIKDGCVMYMTVLNKQEKRSLLKSEGPFMFGFSDVDALLDAISELCIAGYDRMFRSNLYKSEKGYILTVLTDRELPQRMQYILCEFSNSQRKGSVEFARISEKCQLLAESNAIKIASGK